MKIERSLKKALQNPAAVTGLDLRQVKPAILFPEIELFVNLEYIDLSNCPSVNWADACTKLSKLPKLTELKAFGAGIKSLPESFGLLTALKKLDLSCNPELITLPESFASLVHLEEISLHGCGLQQLPETIWHFPVLNNINFGQNKLQTIADNFFEGMPALQYLFLQDNQLTALPASIGSLEKLQLLYAGNNQLIAVPSTVSALKELRTL